MSVMYECPCPNCGAIGMVEYAEMFSGDPLDCMCSSCMKEELARRDIERQKKLKLYDQWDYPADGEDD